MFVSDNFPLCCGGYTPKFFVVFLSFLESKMLPSKGYFNDIECPYLENTCGRPYCHFNHRKKQLENVNETLLEDSSSSEIPTYKPTPKSELAVRKSHIPISYVPDVYKVEKSTRSFRNNTIPDIVYKPTPISLLNSNVKNSANNGNNSDIGAKEGNSSIDIKYVPEIGMQSTAENEEMMKQNKEKYEYKPAEQESMYQYNPTSHEDINEDSLLDIVYKPNSSGLDTLPKVEYTPSICSKQNSNINFENLDNEFNMIDEIINMSDITKNTEDHTFADSDNIVIKNELNKKNYVNALGSNLEHKNTSHTKEIISKTKDSLELDCKSKTHETLKNSHKHKERESHSKESNRHNTKDKPCDTKDKVKEKKERKSGGEEIKKERNDSKSRSKDHKKEKRDRSEAKVKDTTKNDSSKSKEKDRKHSHDKKELQESKEGSSSSKKESEKKNKYKETDKNKRERSHSSHRERDKNKHSKHKSDHKDDGKKEKRHIKYKDKRKGESSDSEFEKKKTMETESKQSATIDFDYDMDIDIDEQQTMEECFRIFNEYKPTVTQEEEEEKSTPTKNEPSSAEELVLSKKRIAHSNASSVPPKIQHPKPISKPTPGQVMHNRFKIIKASQADNEEKLITNELKNIVKRTQPAPLFKPAKKIKLVEEKPVSSNPSLIDEILNKTNSKPLIKKIAPVSNVLNLQKAKENLKLWSKDSSVEQLNKTIAQTNKTGKRQAHVPDYSLSDIPDVIDVEKSKLPVNVRSRYLTLLADECCKLYLTQKDAYKRALDEEYSCYQKCKVLVTYRNSAMLAVNRLRKEVKEREEKNLGLIGSDESSQTKREDAEKVAMYKKIQQYVLTDEELDIHGYPRESSIPGRALIKNRKIISSVPLPKNQKKCCRCSKIYLIDDEGKAIYEEECVYHPLKKRTIRGEHIYLCCKSSDDSGCATCHTHVSETPEDAELEGYQTTLPPNGDSDPRSNAIYALDCEMCYTTKGLELTRVTVIDTNCKTVYESLVKPLNEIIDYNTRFSGITKQQMDRTSTGILQVQANILHLCNSKTILIGHSLESDMKALKIIHGAIIDTAVMFPHKMGLPHKRALRTLASDYLKKIIQNDVGGHDSAEDAITCMELIKWKVKEDSKFKS